MAASSHFMTICTRCRVVFAPGSLNVRRLWRGIGDIHATGQSLLDSMRQSCLICISIVREVVSRRLIIRGQALLIAFMNDEPHSDLYRIRARQHFIEHNTPSLSPDELKENRDLIIEDIFEHLSYTLQLQGWIWIHNNAGKCSLRTFVTVNGIEAERSDLAISLWTETDNISAACIRAPSLSSPAAAALTQLWLRTCCNDHDACRVTTHDHWQPTRLLKIEGDRVRLVICEDEQITAPYITLSHCWGPKPFTSLTTDNLASMKAGMMIDSLPKTFQDVMHFTIALGHEYIWIDVYCILQGRNAASRADWDHESRQMHFVYTHGILNIGATHAMSPDQGLFKQIRRPQPPYACFDWQATSTDSTLQYKIAIPNYSDSGVLPAGPLLHRGWVLQERLLCRRMVFFTDTGLWWECAELPNVTEHEPLVPQFRMDLRGIGPGFLLSSQLEQTEIEEVRRVWHEVVKDYSRCALTFADKDKLRALYGIASVLRYRRREDFLFGHIRSDFPQTLLWSAYLDDHSTYHDHTTMAGTVVRALDRGMPSWSWASVDGYVHFQWWASGKVHQLASMLPVDTMRTIEYGQCSTLAFVGRLLTAKVLAEPTSRRAQLWTAGTKDWEMEVYFDVYDEAEALLINGLSFSILVFWLQADQYSSSSVNGLLLEQQADGCFTKLGISTAYDRTPNTMTGTENWLRQWRQEKPQLILLR